MPINPGPVVTSVVATGTGITAGAGHLNVGSVVTLTLNVSEAVAVSGGTPSLILNDLGTAVYDAAHSTSTALVFNYTVAAGQNTADLAVTEVHLNGATVTGGVPSTVTAGSGQSLTDASGHVWSFGAAGGFYGSAILRDGVPYFGGLGAKLSKDVSGVIWTQNSANEWYMAVGGGWASETTGPTVSISGSGQTADLNGAATNPAGILQIDSAMRVNDLLASFGVVTHIDYTDGGYANISSDLGALQYLGITHVRDAAPNPASDLFGQTHLGDAANAGVQFVFTAQGGIDPSIVVQRLHVFAVAHPGSINGIEGPNEVNNFPVTYQGLTGTAGAQAYQSAFFNAVKADPLLKDIPIIGFTDFPAFASQSDWNNGHPYPINGDQPLASLVAAETAQNAVDPNKPFVFTETGYHTSLTADAAGGREGVDETTQAKLLLNDYMDAALLGVKETYVYQLLDAYPDPGGSNQEKHFGLFRLDYSPKPAATAIHNLTAILHDNGSNAASFSAATLNYSVSGLPATGHTYQAERSDGSFQIIIWNEPDVWDQIANQEIAVPTTNVTANLGQTFSTVEVFDPLQGTTAVQTYHNVSSIPLGLSDHMLIVQATSAVIGQTTIAAGATTEITSAFSGAITFAGSTGTLQLDNSSSFSGTVAGLAGQDTLDLRDINPATVQAPTYSGSSSGGTLTLTDGAHTAKIALLGNYLASTFVTSSDSHGGTAVVDPLLTSFNPHMYFDII
jgi:hypothetical protein